MIETRVYLIKSDVRTECHCGHSINPGENYYMLRTSVPKWISLCSSCKELLGSPTQVCMKELVEKYFETRPPDGNGEKRMESKKKERNYQISEARKKERLEILKNAIEV